MIYPYQQKSPVLQGSVFVAPDAVVTGDVVFGDLSSVFFHAVIRGDLEPITIGQHTNIQDLAMIHTSHHHPCHIGDGVTIGHRATIHGATIASHVLVGMGAIILDGAEIASHSMVAAGSIVPPGKKYPPGVLILGSPARVIRPLTETEIAHINENAAEYVQLAKVYQKQIRG